MVGSTTQNNKLVNGQSMMFQLFVDNLRERNVETIIVDFGKSVDKNFYNKRVSGKFSITKLIDNFLLIFRFVFVLITNPKTSIYITTSQSKVGFVRDYLFISLAKIFNRKIVAHQFGANYHEFFNTQIEGFKYKIKSTLEKTDFVIVEGDFTKEQFRFLPNYKTKVVTISNGLPEKIDSKTISPKNLNIEQPIRLIYLSNLIESKGYWDVLEAINILVNREKVNIEAVFSGKFLQDVEDKMFSSSEQARSEFFNFLKKNKLEERVQYFEGLFGKNKSKAFNDAHFFSLPSYYINEGQPVSVLEALAYGCVPIVTDYRVIPTMVNKENGFFVHPESPEEIVGAIKLMINNPEEYRKKSESGIKFYLDNFTADKYVNKLIELF